MLSMMAADRCGLGSLLPTSCRGRAESFARRLSNRLRSLGHGSGQFDEEAAGAAGGTEPTTDSPEYWGRDTAKDALIASPPDPSRDTDRFYDFDVVEQTSGTSSPANEEDIINESDGLPPECESGCVLASPSQADEADGDSEEETSVYYEPAWGEVLAEAFASLVPLDKRNHEVDVQAADDAGQRRVLIAETTRLDTAPDTKGGTKNYLAVSDTDKASSANGEGDFEKPACFKEKIDSPFEIQAIPPCNSSKEVHEEMLVCDSICSPKVILSRAESLVETESLLHAACDDSQLSTPEDTPRRVQRSSSLKTGKTPPGTPGRKKIVRFADVLGLDLADVRTFMDEIPKVPSCAYWDLHDATLETNVGISPPASPEKCLFPMFQQPSGCPEFIDRLRTQKVCLENAYLGDSMSINGTVRVLNIEFHKSVHIRYTLDNWDNFADLQASYAVGSSDGFSDKFNFVLYANTLDVGQRLEFAVRYMTGSDIYWDNNNGANYAFQCLTPVNTDNNYLTSNLEVLETPPPPEDSGWASFY